MDISSNIASGINPQDPLMGAQIKLLKSSQDSQKNAVETLLGSISPVQPSVEPHLGNKINVQA